MHSYLFFALLLYFALFFQLLLYISSEYLFAYFLIFYSVYSLFCKSRPPSASGDKNDMRWLIPVVLTTIKDSDPAVFFIQKIQ